MNELVRTDLSKAFALGVVLGRKSNQKPNDIYVEHKDTVDLLIPAQEIPKYIKVSEAPKVPEIPTSLEENETLHDWSLNMGKEYCNTLTSRQKDLIIFMLYEKTKATLADLVQLLNEKGYVGSTSYSVAGSFSGLTKKCNHYDIPQIILSDNKHYFLNEKAFDFLGSVL